MCQPNLQFAVQFLNSSAPSLDLVSGWSLSGTTTDPKTLEPSPYKHRPLSGPHVTRVVILQPGTGPRRSIHVRLNEISLKAVSRTRDRYEALSYVWGDTDGSIPIACDGSTMFVTPNCASALKCLRLRDAPRTLWVDSICINQAFNEEKNHQVPLMGRIYESSKQVLISVNPDTRNVDVLFRHINRPTPLLSILPTRMGSIPYRLLSPAANL